MTESISRPQEHIVFTEFDDTEGVLVDLNAKRYYTLNETAMFIWRHLEKGHSREEIVREMTNTYSVTAEHAAASVEKLLGSLQAHKLLS
ncbi:MAG: PqqD family protein [Pyrinomonadaceae bacterium]